MRLGAGADDRAGLDDLITALSEAHDHLRCSGLTTACAYVRASAASLRLAASAAATVRSRDVEVLKPLGEVLAERPTLLDGRHLGVLLVPRTDGYADLVPSPVSADGNDATIAGKLDWPEGPNLGADLLASDAAKAFIADDVSAALLLHALHSHAWTSVRRGARWLCSPQAASILLRAMRNGRPAAPLAPQASGGLIPIGVVHLLHALGWHPDR